MVKSNSGAGVTKAACKLIAHGESGLLPNMDELSCNQERNRGSCKPSRDHRGQDAGR